ncbi:hypothetical protein [Spirosoma arcticum]
MKRLLVPCLLLLHSIFATAALAQSGSTPKTYTYLIYHKLTPGLTIQDALSVEREWRAINQAAVDEGQLIGWHMMVKQMSSNPNANEYDYVTCIVSREMAIKGASPAAMTKLYGDSVQTRMANLQKRDRQTAPVVKFEVWENADALFGPSFRPDKFSTVVVDFLRLRDPQANWRPMIDPMKRAGAGQVEQNRLGAWGFSALVVPNGSEKGYSFAVARPVANLNVLAGIADQKPTDAQNQMNRTFEVVRQEVFRFQEFTTRPTTAK